jgi:hypothetical protein
MVLLLPYSAAVSISDFHFLLAALVLLDLLIVVFLFGFNAGWVLFLL